MENVASRVNSTGGSRAATSMGYRWGAVLLPQHRTGASALRTANAHTPRLRGNAALSHSTGMRRARLADMHVFAFPTAHLPLDAEKHIGTVRGATGTVAAASLQPASLYRRFTTSLDVLPFFKLYHIALHLNKTNLYFTRDFGGLTPRIPVALGLTFSYSPGHILPTTHTGLCVLALPLFCQQTATEPGRVDAHAIAAATSFRLCWTLVYRITALAPKRVEQTGTAAVQHHMSYGTRINARCLFSRYKASLSAIRQPHGRTARAPHTPHGAWGEYAGLARGRRKQWNIKKARASKACRQP